VFRYDRGREREGAAARLQFTIATPAPINWVTLNGPRIEATGQWHHLAVVKTLNAVRLFVDGRKSATLDARGMRFLASPTNVFLGVRRFAFVDRRFQGDIRAFRISSSARYREDFTPDESFSRDDMTLVLFQIRASDRNIVEDLSGERTRRTGWRPPLRTACVLTRPDPLDLWGSAEH
jgi:hypothetical protein